MPITNFCTFLLLIFELHAIFILVTCIAEAKLPSSFLHSNYLYFSTLFLSFRCSSIFNSPSSLFAQSFIEVLYLLSIINTFIISIFSLVLSSIAILRVHQIQDSNAFMNEVLIRIDNRIKTHIENKEKREMEIQRKWLKK